MQLLSLQIKNFRVIKWANLTFPDNIIGIIGPNGAGKSSIIEAVAWALYGNPAARSGREQIKSGYAGSSESCEVTLTFNVRGEEYCVLRKLVGRTERLEVEVTTSGQPAVVGSTETRKYIEHLLGLDLKGFQSSFLARQQELNALSDLQPAKRREHLAGMLGIERLDRAIQFLKQDVKIYGEKADVLQRQLLDKGLIEERLRELREHDSNLAGRIEQLSGARNAAKENLDRLVETHKQQQDKQVACSQLKARLEALSRTRVDQRQQHDELIEDRKKLAAAQHELKSLEPQLAGLAEIKSKLEKLKELKSRFQWRRDLLGQQKSIKADQTRQAASIDQNRKKLTEKNSELSKLPKELEASLHRAQNDLEQARENYTSKDSRIKAGQIELKKITGQLSSLEKIGPETVCDRCHRPYGDDLPQIREHLESEQKELENQIQSWNEELEEQKKIGKSIKERADELEKFAQQKYTINVDLNSLQNEHTRLLEDRAKLDEKSATLKKQLAELGEVEFDEKELERLSAQTAELEKKQQQVNELKGRVMSLPKIEERLEKTAARLEQLEKETADFEAELNKLDFDEYRFTRLTDDLEAARIKYEDSRNDWQGALQEQKMVRREIQLKEEQLAGLNKAEKEIEEYRDGQFYGEKLGQLFGDFRKFIIARIRPRLGEISGELMDEMTDGRYQMVELDENYNLQVMDLGEYFPVERFSGGEKDLANLCLRLAISLALTESAGLDRSFVILDEVFGSQDDERKELIFKGLASLKNRFPQMLLVTHIQELKDKVEQLIQVRPTSGGWSEVSVDGRVV